MALADYPYIPPNFVSGFSAQGLSRASKSCFSPTSQVALANIFPCIPFRIHLKFAPCVNYLHVPCALLFSHSIPLGLDVAEWLKAPSGAEPTSLYPSLLHCLIPPYPGGGLSQAMMSLNSCLLSRAVVLYLENFVDRQRCTPSINEDFKSSFTLVPRPNVDSLLLGRKRRQLLTDLQLNTTRF